MRALLLLLFAAFVNVDAASGQEEIGAEVFGIRAKRNGKFEQLHGCAWANGPYSDRSKH